MKNYATALNTKKMLVASLKKFMVQKPLSKITVAEIVKDCNVNRNTFYYHFQDIYALLQWMLEEEAFEVVKQFDLINDFEKVVEFAIDYVDKNKYILNCAYDTMGREELKRFLYADFIGVANTMLEGVEKKAGAKLDEKKHRFLCEFYIEALASVLVNWFRGQSIWSREEVVQYIVQISETMLSEATLKKLEEK